jgi:hypothetical protein
MALPPHSRIAGYRLIVGLLLLSFSAPFLLAANALSRLLGGVLAGGGVLLMGYALAVWWKERRAANDPYALSRLWDEPAPGEAGHDAEEPDEDAAFVARDLVFCRHCGASMPEAYRVCPECGVPLGN